MDVHLVFGVFDGYADEAALFVAFDEDGFGEVRGADDRAVTGIGFITELRGLWGLEGVRPGTLSADARPFSRFASSMV